MRLAGKERRGRTRVLLALLVVLSFSIPGMNKESTAGLPDSNPVDYRLTNFYIIDVNIADALEGLAAIARARGGNLFALVDRKAVRAVPVNMKLREGIGLTEAMAELARVHGYSCYWDLSAGAVVIGNEQSLRDYGTKETRLYDPGRRTAEEFVTALSAVIPRERLSVGLAGGFLQVTTGSLEHRIIGEKVSALRSAEEEGITFAIKVKTLTAAGGGIRGLNPSRPAAAGPYFTRLNQEEQAEADRLTNGGSPAETFSLHAVLYRNNRQFIGELLPAVAAEGEGVATAGDSRKVGVTLDLTLLDKAGGATLALQAGINRITDWRETAGGAPVPVIETEEAGAILSLRGDESCVLSGLAVAAGGRDPGRTGYIHTGSTWGELLFGGGQKPGEKKDLAIFINSLASATGYGSTAEETPALVLPVAGTPAGAAELKEEKTPKEAETTAVAGSTKVPEGTAAVESTTLWEAEVVELGSLGQSQTGKPAPEPEKTEAPAVLGGEEVPEPEEPGVSATLGSEPAPAPEKPEAPVAPTGGQEEAVGERKEPKPEVFLPGTAEVGLVITYKPQKGEDLPAIAAKYGIPVEALSRTNNLSPDAPLPAGADLVVPIPVTHLYILQPGETLWRLARKYGTTPELLMEINQINDVTQLGIGQIIILPKPVDQAVEEN